jgi:hypothetical protein
LEFLANAIDSEHDGVAREGLAIGLARQYLPQLADSMLQWFVRENNPIIRIALARHFPDFAGRNAQYKEFVISRLEEGICELPEAIMYARASVNDDIRDEVGKLDYAKRQQREIDMSRESKTTVGGLSAGGNITIGTYNTGTIQGSVENAIETMNTADPLDRELQNHLKSYLGVLEAHKGEIPDAVERDLKEALVRLAEAPKQPLSTRKSFVSGVLDTLVRATGDVSKLVALAEATEKLADSVGHLFGLH